MRELYHFIVVLHYILYQHGVFSAHSRQDVDSNDENRNDKTKLMEESQNGASNINQENIIVKKMERDNERSIDQVERNLRHVNTRRVQDSSSWQGCIDPNNPDLEDNLVSLGKRTTICIVVSQGGNWGNGNLYSRWVFQPIADEYSRFVIKSSYANLVKNPNNFYYPAVSVHVESQQSLSFIRRYFDDSHFQSWVFPYLTAIVSVKNGVITGITWDESCAFCDESRCVENTYDFSGKNVTESTYSVPSKSCYFTKAECDNLVASGESTCALGIYFVWTGTDKDKKVLRSVDARFGAFPPNRIPKIENYLPKFNIPVFGG